MINLAEEGSQRLHEMGPLQGPTSGRLKIEPDGDMLTVLTILSHDILSPLFSMTATLKLLNRGYYGKMEEEAAQKIEELLSQATRLTGTVEACLERTSGANEEVQITAPNRIIEHLERNTPNKPASMETKGRH